MTNRYAEVHIKAQAMRRKLTKQSRELEIEKNRRFLEGVKQTDTEADEAMDNAYKIRMLLRALPQPIMEIEYED